MYFGEDYHPSDKITIRQPTIGEIMRFGDSKFYSILNIICGNPTMFRLKLWDLGVDWNTLTDFEWFCTNVRQLSIDDTYLLFGDLNFSWFELFHNKKTDSDVLINIPHDANNNISDDFIESFDYENAIIIDEIIYIKIVEYLRKMFNIHPKVEKAKNKFTKEAIIEEERMNIENQKILNKGKEVSTSVLLPMISFALNHPGFKYKKKELIDVGIVEFMDSVSRLQIYESTHALMSGMYSGYVDTKKINKDEFNFMRQIK